MLYVVSLCIQCQTVIHVGYYFLYLTAFLFLCVVIWRATLVHRNTPMFVGWEVCFLSFTATGTDILVLFTCFRCPFYIWFSWPFWIYFHDGHVHQLRNTARDILTKAGEAFGCPSYHPVSCVVALNDTSTDIIYLFMSVMFNAAKDKVLASCP